MKSKFWAVNFTALVLLFSFICGADVYATENNNANVDLSKGVVYDDEYGYTINLNGNSVIITEAESVDSGDKSDYIDIYIDKNQDGVINSGETKIKLERKTNNGSSYDIPANVNIYGLKQVSSTTPIRITVLSGKLTGTLYGVYYSSLKLSDSTKQAFFLDIQGGKFSSVYGAYNSTIEGKTDIKARKAEIESTVYGVYYNSHVTGDVSLDLDDSSLKYSVYGIYDNSKIDGDFSFNIGSKIKYQGYSYIYGIYNSEVTGNVDLSTYGSDSKNYSAYLYSIYGKVGGKTNINCNKGIYNYIYGVYSNGEFLDSYTLNFNDVECTGTIYGFYYAKCDGNVDVTLKNTTFNYLYGFYGSYPYTQNYNVKGNVNVSVDNTNTWTCNGSIIAAYYVNCLGDCTIDLHAKALENVTYSNSIYGLEYGIVGKNLELNISDMFVSSLYATYLSGSDVIKGDAKITVKDNKVTSSIYGMYYGGCLGNVTTIIDNNTNASTYNCSIYGVYSISNIEGDCAVSITNNPGKYNYIYGLSLNYNGTVKGNADVKVQKTSAASGDGTLYALQNGSIEKDITITADEVSYAYLYGTYNVSSMANETITVKNSTFKTTSNNNIYGKSGGVTMGKFDLKFINCETDYTYVYGVSGAGLLGESNVLIDGGEEKKHISASSFYPVYESGYSNSDITYDNTITAVVKNVEFDSTDSFPMISNNIVGNQTFRLTMDDSCVIPDSYMIYPTQVNSSSTVDAQAFYKENIYYGGIAKNDKDLIYDKTKGTGYQNVYFVGSNAELSNNVSAEKVGFIGSDSVIPKNITVSAEDVLKVDNGYYGSTGVMLEGTLKGTLATDNNGKSNGKFFMNGGSLDVTNEEAATVLYYPISVSYNEKGGVLTSNALIKHNSRPDVQFCKVGANNQITLTPILGYNVNGGTIKYDGDSNNSILSHTSTDTKTNAKTYSFEMKNKPATVVVNVVGNQIVVGKTKADPVTKVNETYTSEKPLYNLATLKISNDSKVGEVTYEVDSTNSLPEGLELEDGKIIGTPSKAYEDGKLTKIKVIGKNDTYVYITLNIVVSEGEGLQGNQDGRIYVDEEKKIVDLFSNSIVMDAVTENDKELTAIYLDDNRDGVADSSKPVVSMDLSEYAIYGAREDENVDTPIRITMKGGKVLYIYGLYASNSTCESDQEDSVDISITGGYARYSYALMNGSTTKGRVSVVGAKSCVYSCNFFGTGTNTAKGYYCNNAGDVSLGGSYRLKDSIDVSYVSINTGAEIIIPANVTMKTTSFYLATNAFIYNYGTIENDNAFNTNSRIYMMEGSNVVATENAFKTWPCYYPVTFTMEKEGTNVESVGTNVVTNTYDENAPKYFAKKDSDCIVYVTSIAGYEYWYKLDDGEEKLSESNKITFAMEHKATNVSVSYRAHNISVQKKFNTVVALSTTEYTEKSPLFDYSVLNVDYDSVEDKERTYALKEGSSLPDGLRLVNGKVVGKATSLDEEGIDVTVTVTGQNGTSDDVTMTYRVLSSSTSVTKELDTITYSGITTYLNGVSVVIDDRDPSDFYFEVYSDSNHDGIADSPFKRMISTTCNSIYGYSDSTKPLNKDLSIYLNGGTFREVCGASTYSVSDVVTVNGSVDVYVTGASIQNRIYAGSNAVIEKDAGLHFSMGSVSKDNAVVTNKSHVKGNVYLDMTKQFTYCYSGSMNYIANASTIDQNVYMNYAVSTGSYGLKMDTSSNFSGVYSSTVGGDVNCSIAGEFKVGRILSFLHTSKVKGDLNVDVKSGYINTGTTIVMNNTFSRDSEVNNIEVRIDDKAVDSYITAGNYSTMYIVQGYGSAKNVTVYIPTGCKTSSYVSGQGSATQSSASIDSVFVLNRGNLNVKGNCEYDKELKTSNITIQADSSLTVKGDVTNTGSITNNGKFVNYGKFDNQGALNNNSVQAVFENFGTFTNKGYAYNYGLIDNEGELTFNVSSAGSSSAHLIVYGNAQLINRAKGTLTLACRINNAGKIVNLGSMVQTYTGSSYYALGTVFSVNKIDIAYENYYQTYVNYSKLYYPISLEYDDKLGKAVLTSAADKQFESSGVEGDDTVYVRSGDQFYVTVSDLELNYKVSSVTYNYMGQDKNASNEVGEEGVFYGVAYSEPTKVKVDLGTVAASVIEISPTSAEVDPLTVGIYKGSVYSLGANVKVSNDTNEKDANVTYFVAKGNELPEGLYLNESNGGIYGTPAHASEKPVSVKIGVRGKNQSVALFTLTIKAINKGTFSLSGPTMYGQPDKTLSTVSFSIYNNVYGNWSWADGEQELDPYAGETRKFDAYYTPKSSYINDYVWEKTSGATWNEEEQRLEKQLDVKVNGYNPEFEIPTDIVAYYGQKLGDVDLSKYETEDGSYEWYINQNSILTYMGVGNYYISYIPKSSRYNPSYGNRVTVNVLPYPVESVPVFSEFEAEEGDCLSDITLPQDENGQYKWITVASTEVQDGEKYTIAYEPKDIVHYDYTGVPGWNATYNAVVFDVHAIVFKDGILKKIEITGLPVEVRVDHGTQLSKIKLPVRKFNENQMNTWYLDNLAVSNPIEVGDLIPAGHFEWENPDAVIDTEYSFETTVKYVPDNKKYEVATAIPVKVFVSGSHKWVTTKVTKEPTYKEYGEQLMTCSLCKKESKGLVDKLIQKTPEYEAPEIIEAQYGTVLRDIDLSSYDNEIGHFEWQTAIGSSVGDAGEHTCYLKFVPDSEEYKTISSIAVTVKVNPIVIESIDTFNEVYGHYNALLKDLVFPEVSDGYYRWVDSGSNLAMNQKTYQVEYVPDNTWNYDYSNVKGWNEKRKAIAFDVVVKLIEEDDMADYTIDQLPVKVVATHGKTLASVILPTRKFNSEQEYAWFVDGTEIVNAVGKNVPVGHFEWSNPNELVTAENGFTTTVNFIPDNENFPVTKDIVVTVSVKGSHTWDEYVITKPATQEETGTKEVICTTCGAKKEEIIDKLPPIVTTEEDTTEASTEVTTEEDTTEASTEVTTEEDTTEATTEVTTEEDTTETTTEATTEVSTEVTTEEEKKPETPTFVVPEGVTAVYGQTLADVDLSAYATEIGKFVWKDSLETSVGTAGEHEFMADFVTDSDKYSTVENVKITVKVSPIAINHVELFDELEGIYGNSLADIRFPYTRNGEFKWLEDTLQKVESGNTYKFVYIPEDVVNYDYSNIIGWNDAKKGIVFETKITLSESDEMMDYVLNVVPVEIVANHGAVLSEVQLPVRKVNADQEYAWYLDGTEIANATVTDNVPMGHFEWADPDERITSEGNQELKVVFVPDSNKYPVMEDITLLVKVKGTHSWDLGVVTLEPTTKDEGNKRFTCEICGTERNEVLPVVEESETTENTTDVTTEEEKTTEVVTEEKTTEVATEEKTTEVTTEEKTTEVTTEVTTEEKTTEVTTEEKTTEVTTEVTTEEKTTEVTTEEKTTEVTTEATTEEKTTESKTEVTTEQKTTESKTETTTENKKPSAPNKIPSEKVGTIIKDAKSKLNYVVVASENGVPCVAVKGAIDKKIKTVTIPNSIVYNKVTYNVVEISAKAFKGCTKLSKVTIGNQVKKIGKNAFEKCTALKTVTVGSNVQKIDSKAFLNCNKLKKFTIKSSKINSIGKQAFKKTGSKNYKKLVIKVPKAKAKEYKAKLKKAGLNAKAKVK